MLMPEAPVYKYGALNSKKRKVRYARKPLAVNLKVLSDQSRLSTHDYFGRRIRRAHFSH